MPPAKPTTSATAEEEWAEGVDGFFADFGAVGNGGPSQRKRSRTAALARRHGGGAMSAMDEGAHGKADRADVVAAARRRITAAVASRASAKEIARAQRRARRERGAQPASGASADDGGSLAASTSASAAAAERIEPHTRLCNKRGKLAQKMERKAQRREEQRAYAIKHRKALRKGARRAK